MKKYLTVSNVDVNSVMIGLVVTICVSVLSVVVTSSFSRAASEG